MSKGQKKRCAVLRRLAQVAVGLGVATSLAATLVRPRWFGLVYHLPGGDKAGHFLILGAVTFLVALGFTSARIRGRRLGVAGCALLVGAVVTVDELLQLLLPYRSFSWGDLLANWLGILTFGALAWLVLWILARRRRRPA
jgi:VanZ family protein